ncbi:MAG: carboxypeptidase M32 [Candidatus Woesearchaeota archaeon]
MSKILKETEHELSILKEIAALLDWDSKVAMPRLGATHRGEQNAYIALKIHEIMTNSRLDKEITQLQKKKLKDLDNKIVNKYAKQIIRLKNIPHQHVEEYTNLQTVAYDKWIEAREKNDYHILEPHLKKIFAMKRKEATYIDPKKNPYDVLLEKFHEGMTVEKIDKIFAELKPKLIALLRKTSPVAYTIKGDFSNEKQFALCSEISATILQERDRFGIGKTVHPFMTTIGPDDFRITTSIRDDPFFSLMSTVHETGHALYEMNFKKRLRGTILFDAASFSLHESQSRFWENHIARSNAFWDWKYPAFKKVFNIRNTQNEFVKKLNEIKNSPIRIETGELAYGLHIIIRYELEKALIEGSLSVEKLPEVWNAKYQEYLGINPKTMKEGVLQDMHWVMDGIGYFPTYLLGSIYAAMIYKTMNKSFAVEKDLAKGDFTRIRTWLKEHIHQYGASKTTEEIVQDACGKPIDINSYIAHLKKTYGV